MPRKINRSAAHQALQGRCLVELSRLECMAWANATGKARAMDNPRRIISYGLKGSSDIIAIVSPVGVFLGVEIKTGKGRQSPDQLRFEAAVDRVGAAYATIRDVAEIEPIVKLIREGGRP